MPDAHASLDIRPIGNSFAKEVRGVDLWKPLQPETVAALSTAWAVGGVLVFRRQALSEDEIVDFGSYFGEPTRIVRADWGSAARPEIIHISNMKNQAGRSIGGLGAGELDWHTDQSYVLDPATGAVLYMIEMPADPPRTYWANLVLAYDALPQATKERIEGLSAVYDYVARQSTYDDEKPMSAELRAQTPPVTHPLVNTHPVTGRKSLYLDPTTTVGIAGLDDAAGVSLLAELNAHATQARFVYAHDWQVGDLILWDNGMLLHRRDPFDPAKNRLLKRTTLRLPPDRHIVPASALAA